MAKKILFLIFSFILLSFNIQAQVTASFTMSRDSGCDTGFDVNFTDNSTGNITSWTWDFGKGGSPLIVTSPINPQNIAYVASGTYIVSLTVTDGTDIDVFTDTIIVHESPTAIISSYSEHIGCAPLTVNFRNLSDANTTSWYWGFANGTSSTEFEPTATFTANSYTIYLKATDDLTGCFGETSIYNYVISATKPNINFSADPLYSCAIPTTVNYTNTSTSAYSGNLTYVWDFGDSNSSTEINPSNIYANYGLYSPKLIATNEYNCSDSLTKQNFINIETISTDFAMSTDTTCIGNLVAFTNYSVGGGNFTWYFGDGTTDNTENTTHNYTSAGVYTVSLVNQGSVDCADSITQTIVIDSIVAMFYADTTYSCTTPFTVNFADRSYNVDTWTWNFGNDSTAIINGINGDVSHTYILDTINVDTSFTVSLTVTNHNSCSAIYTVTDLISIVYPTVEIIADNYRGCVPLDVTVSANTSSNETITSTIWDFGDGQSSVASDTTITYTNDSVYIINLTITNSSGCTASDTLWIATGTIPNANFSWSSDTSCFNDVIQFTDLSTDNSSDTSNIDWWHWNFANGFLQSSLQNPTFTIPDSVGYLEVELVVGYNGCLDTLTLDSTVFFNGPNILASTGFSCDSSFVYWFRSDVMEATKVYWDFDNDGTLDDSVLFAGVESRIDTVWNTFPTTNNYTAAYLAVNDSTGCTFDGTVNLAVREIIADFSISDTIPCSYEEITFNGQTSQEAVEWEWSIIDTSGAEIIIGNGDTINYIFDTTGIFDIRLVAFDVNNCSDTLVKTIKTNLLFVGFQVDALIGCIPFDVQFTDTTLTDTTLVSWLWNFGDGTTDTLQNPQHIYNSIQQNTVSLTVVDTLGCTFTTTTNNYIISTKPRPAFNVSDQTICFGQSASFANNTIRLTSPGANYEYLWDFGDGGTSTDFTPIYTYTDTGYFAVSLTAIDTSLGCDSTLIKTDYIHVQPIPVADFTIDTNYSSCYPKIAILTNTSNYPYVQTINWDFGDGSLASVTTDSAQHAYIFPGTYSIGMTIISTYGCSNSILKTDTLEVDGAYAAYTIEPKTACRWEDISFIIRDTINVVDYEWSFYDGAGYQIGINDTTIYQYTQSGSFRPTLHVQGNGTTGCMEKFYLDSVFIRPYSSDFEPDTNQACVPNTFTFTNNSTNEDSLFWNFGDGTSQNIITTNTIQHEYDTAGVYQVQLITKTSDACQDTINKAITVFPLPTITITDSTLLCRGDSLQLNATGGNQYLWLPNIAISDNNINNPNVSPQNSTTYNLTVTDINNCVNDSSVFVYVQPLPSAFFDAAANTTLCAGESLLFVANPVDTNLYDYVWNFNCEFGEDSTYFITNPNHVFADSGYYDIQLIIIDTVGCDSIYNRNQHVHVQSIPVADFTVDSTTTTCYPRTLTFSDTSAYLYNDPTSSPIWDFGNGQSATIETHPSATYTNPGEYTVTLIVKSSYGCADTIVKQNYIDINGPYAEFSINPDTICKWGTISLSIDSINEDVDSWEWEFGDGSANSVENPVAHTYSESGDYYPVLHIYDENNTCDTVAAISDNIYVREFVAQFTLDTNKACLPATFLFTNTSIDASVVNWDISDGNIIESITSFTHEYFNEGIYNIIMYAYDSNGCSDTAYSSLEVFSNPVLTISSDSLICLGESIQLNSTGGEIYSWSPSSSLDNASIANPIATPNVETEYLVVVTDANGCTNDTSLTINVQQGFDMQILTNDTLITLGDSMQIITHADTNVIYSWLPNQEISCIDCANPIVWPKNKTIYEAYIIDTVGCFNNKYYITIDVSKPTIEVPLAFTPNNDFNNDTIYVNGWGLEQLLEFNIYNRWGVLIFTSNDLNIGWDGKYNGEIQNNGTYIYTARAKSYNGEILETKGTINLIK